MACSSSEALNWKWTPHWCPLFVEMDPRSVELRSVSVSLWWRAKKKERTYPELTAPRSRARLVVLAMEVGGRWSPEALTFIRLLARAKARHEPNLMRRRVEQAWRMRWCSLGMRCSPRARHVALGIEGLKGGADGVELPSHEVEGDHRHSGLSDG